MSAGSTYTWGLDDRLKTPYSQVFDLSIERDLGHSYSLDLPMWAVWDGVS